MNNELISAIRLRMKLKGLNTTTLSLRSGVPYSTLCKFLSAESDLGSSKLMNVLDAMDLNLVSLITFKDRDFLSKFPINVQKHLMNIAEGA